MNPIIEVSLTALCVCLSTTVCSLALACTFHIVAELAGDVVVEVRKRGWKR